jgi:hypothetical protein
MTFSKRMPKLERQDVFRPGQLACCAQVLQDFSKNKDSDARYFIIDGRVFYATTDMDDRIIDWAEYKLTPHTLEILEAIIRLHSFHPRTGSFTPSFALSPLKEI